MRAQGTLDAEKLKEVASLAAQDLPDIVDGLLDFCKSAQEFVEFADQFLAVNVVGVSDALRAAGKLSICGTHQAKSLAQPIEADEAPESANEANFFL